MHIEIMKKKKEFHVVNDKNNKIYTLIFSYKDATINFDLSYEEWRLLLKLIKTTKSKKYLPKGEDAYSGINIDTGKLMYYSWEIQHQLIEEIIKNSTMPKNKVIAWNKRYTSDIKENFLDKQITIIKNNVVISLSRKKFLRFREYCLKLKI